MDIERQGNEIHANENLNPISTITTLDAFVEDYEKRRSMWLEFLVIKGKNFSDGKKRAQCLHCKKATFIAIAQYETSNMKKHLEKCKAYQAAKAFEEREGEKRTFDWVSLMDFMQDVRASVSSFRGPDCQGNVCTLSSGPQFSFFMALLLSGRIAL
ncbi:hypothetical protein Cgig2_000981 [Carnegiea gigantea]|uniref:BED-type domain-containing protein n=1 Tax=Carnegiea gigantea TaxID=171969 RepID=A0A9Q1QC02_9CARY|nr:hypothetical protein Cgig2_000981 [Carnegiea gigantea]